MEKQNNKTLGIELNKSLNKEYVSDMIPINFKDSKK